jgi:alkylhydroperoxidase family enzyme
MPRLRQVPRGAVHPDLLPTYQRLFGDRDPVASPGTATGTPGNWWTVMALVPDVLRYFQAGSAMYKSDRRVLTSYFRELAILRAGFARGSRFVYSQHCKGARAAGLPEAKIGAIPAWSSSDAFDQKERAVLAYVDEIVLADGRVQDATFSRLQQHFQDEAILELTYVVGLYLTYATITRALRLEYDDVDERVTEVPAPKGGAEKVDILSAISGDEAAR